MQERDLGFDDPHIAVLGKIEKKKGNSEAERMGDRPEVYGKLYI
jgi:hypothetical protein